MGMLAGGNTVVFNPHPAAIKTSIYAINLLNEASLEAGGPDNIAVTVEKPTLETKMCIRDSYIRTHECPVGSEAAA